MSKNKRPFTEEGKKMIQFNRMMAKVEVELQRKAQERNKNRENKKNNNKKDSK